MEVNPAHDDFGDHDERKAEVPPAAAAVDNRWPGGVMVLLLLVAVGWPLVTLAAALPACLFVDRDQGMVLAGVGGACMLLRWALGA